MYIWETYKLYNMNENTLFSILALCFFWANSQKQRPNLDIPSTHYQNPIFSGDFPDPSILVDGDDYYMIHSSFDYHPGLTVWHSKDLINWSILTNALEDPIGSVWAPELIKHKDKYYIYFPSNNTNYVISADKMEGPWSKPTDLGIGNIDPGHIADEKGNRYLYFPNGGYVPLTKDGLAVKGEEIHSYDGWTIPRDWVIECMCMEGPKLFKRGNYYYLTVAQGGTAGPPTGHMVISARSKSPLGPWENSPHNPIIRTENPDDQWASVGHATVIETGAGETWMIFHGYEKEHYNMGRQTLLAPLEWTDDGWFKMPENIDISKPILRPSGKSGISNYQVSDSFEGSELNPKWHFFEDFDKNRFKVENNSLKLKAKGTGIANSAPLLITPSDHSYSVSVELEIKGNAIGGLVLFYNEKSGSGILADQKNIISNIRDWQSITEKEVIDRKVHLKMVNINNVVNQFYSLDGKQWTKIKNSLEVSGIHHNALSGFLSLRIGLVAIGDGEVYFKNFQYQPNPTTD